MRQTENDGTRILTDSLTHGLIAGGTIGTPDLEAALGDYVDRLGLRLVEDGALDPGLAATWGCPGVAGARFATLQPASGAPCFVRLVEQPLAAGFVPTTSYGWGAYEITVQGVFDWPGKLAGGGFDILGMPKETPGLPYFVAMQMLGRGQEMIYLNEVRADTPTLDLPRAGSPVDHVFIVILATPDRAATSAWYATRLGLTEGDRFVIPYSMINRAFGLPSDTTTTISMMQVDRMPVIEIDDYPAAAIVRPRDTGMLPPGNAMVTLAVDRLDRPGLDFIAPPAVRRGPFYRGMRSATVIGSAGELLELVEIG